MKRDSNFWMDEMAYEYDAAKEKKKAGYAFLASTVLVLLFVIGATLAWPKFDVYRKTMAGQGLYRQAESDRQIKVLEAQALLDSASKVAEAEIARAHGVAEANRIIADSLGGPEGYLRWRYIEMLENSSSSGNRDIIYLPTEAGLPILESPRLLPRQRGQGQ